MKNQYRRKRNSISRRVVQLVNNIYSIFFLIQIIFDSNLFCVQNRPKIFERNRLQEIFFDDRFDFSI